MYFSKIIFCYYKNTGYKKLAKYIIVITINDSRVRSMNYFEMTIELSSNAVPERAPK